MGMDDSRFAGNGHLSAVNLCQLYNTLFSKTMSKKSFIRGLLSLKTIAKQNRKD